MKLHLTTQAFKDAILATSQYYKIREVYIEKDYWVTYVLKQLALSKYKDEVIFKGGTSLSKAYHCIDRFSEDIDLAIESGERSGNQIKSLLSKVQKTITKELPEIEVEGLTRKFSKYRKTVHQYERVLDDANFGQAIDMLIVETNAFTSPNPNSLQLIDSYIAAYLKEQGSSELIAQFELEPFEVNCLNVERTFTEKIMGLVRICYMEYPIENLKKKIRHIYDLNRILQLDIIQAFIKSEEFYEMINKVKIDDSSNHEFEGEWMKQPLHSALLFDEIENTWQQLESTYAEDFKPLVYGELPSSKSILESLNLIKSHIKDYS